MVGTGLGSVPGFGLPADQGRPRVSEVVGYWPAFIGTEHVEVEVWLTAAGDPRRQPGRRDEATPRCRSPALPLPPCGGEMVEVALVELCLARSGDKGDACNAGRHPRSDAIFSWMLDHLNTDFVKEHFGGVCRGAVERPFFPTCAQSTSSSRRASVVEGTSFHSARPRRGRPMPSISSPPG